MSPLMGRPSLEGRHLTGRALLLLGALLLAATPISQLLAGSSWLLLALTGAAPVVLGGIVLRHLLDRPMLVPLLQLGLVLVLLLVVETLQGLAPWQDGPVAVIAAQTEVMRLGVQELASGVPPLALGAPGTVIVVVLAALLALLLDLLFLDLGWHTPTALLLMSTVLVPALQQPSGGPWWHVAGPLAAGTAILVTRTVHGDPRYLEGDRRPQAGPAPRPARTLGAAVLCVVLVAGLAQTLGAALPQVAEPRIALNVEMLNRWKDPDTPQLGPVMIDDDVSVRRSLLEQSDTEVLRYTTTAENPSYLRLRTLNRFDGETFHADPDGEEPSLGVSAFSDARGDGVPVRGSAADFESTDVQVMSLGGDRLPMPENVREVSASSPALDRAITLQPTDGEAVLDFVPEGLTGQSYTVRTEQRTSTAEQLRAVSPAAVRTPFETGYTSREEVPQVAADLAEQLVSDAGAENGFDAAVAFQDYFRTSFAYSLTVNTPAGEDPLESFLDDRIGYCEQFASTFALMMTAQGYPTRVVIGFTAGDADGDERTVTARNAHAWPEVWFGPEHGWVRFEPTPAAAANGVSTPEVTELGPSAEDVETPEETTATPTTEEESASSEEGTTEEQSTATTEAGQGSEQGPSAATVQRIEWGAVGVLGIAGLLATAAAVVVLLIRRRRVRAREARWAALLDGSAGAADGAGGPADGAGGPADGPAGAAEGEDGAADDGAAALEAERLWRRAGDLAWSELTHELAVRATAIRWLGLTGAWGRPPKHLAMDPTLPPHRAVEELLDRIAEGTLEVTAEDRAAAARLADAYTDATYAAPVPARSASAAASAPVPSTTPSGPGGRSAAGGRGAAGDGGPAGPREDAGAPAAQHLLRADADRVVELLRTAR
jgi:transglutaminase-like putative cysteine protease